MLKNLLVIIVGLIILVVLYSAVVPRLKRVPQEIFMCTTDAKLCPDGSAVGREGPNCEFAACPGE